MKSFFGVAALAMGASAAMIPRSDTCCFKLNASGAENGTIGQLSDGQVRIGGGLSPSTFCINNGAVTDSNGYGCIITEGVTQFQCNENAPPYSGYSVSSTGAFLHNSSSTWYACPASDTEWNIYEQPVANQLKCVEVSLATVNSKCAAANTTTSSTCSASTVTVTVTVSAECEASTTSAVEVSTTTSVASVATTPSTTSVVETSAVETSAVETSAVETSAVETSAVETTPSITSSVVETSAIETSAVETSAVETTPVTTSAVETTVSTTSAVETTTSSAVSAVSPVEVSTTKTSSVETTSAETTPVVESTTSSTVESTTSVATTATPSVYTSSVQTYYTSETETETSTGTVTTYTSPTPTPYYSNTTMTSSSSTTSSATTTTASSSCVVLEGTYATPLLIVPVSEDSPDTAYGTSYFGYANSTTSTIFNFDIPSDYEGLTCKLVFLFPTPSELETSSYSWNGAGGLTFTELSSPATEETTYDTIPSTESTLATITLAEGSDYTLQSGSCSAGSTLTVEMSAEAGSSLEFFEDWNPCSLGLFVMTE